MLGGEVGDPELRVELPARILPRCGVAIVPTRDREVEVILDRELLVEVEPDMFCVVPVLVSSLGGRDIERREPRHTPPGREGTAAVDIARGDRYNKGSAHAHRIKLR